MVIVFPYLRLGSTRVQTKLTVDTYQYYALVVDTYRCLHIENLYRFHNRPPSKTSKSIQRCQLISVFPLSLLLISLHSLFPYSMMRYFLTHTNKYHPEEALHQNRILHMKYMYQFNIPIIPWHANQYLD